MISVPTPEPRHGDQVRAFSFAVAILFASLGKAAPARVNVQPPSADQVEAMRNDCASETIPFMFASTALGEQLRGRDGVHILRQFSFIVSRPDRMRIRRLASGAMKGVLTDGCPFAFWWTGHPALVEHGEIRVGGPEHLSGPGWSFLGHPPGPPPREVPAIEGYRHIMSSAALSGNFATTFSPGAPYVGMWHRTDGATGSLIVHHRSDGGGVIRLGTVGRTYDAVYAAAGIHDISFTLLKGPSASEPLHVVNLTWSEPGSCCGGRRQRGRQSRRDR